MLCEELDELCCKLFFEYIVEVVLWIKRIIAKSDIIKCLQKQYLLISTCLVSSEKKNICTLIHELSSKICGSVFFFLFFSIMWGTRHPSKWKLTVC